jgi:hypothetical protein
MSQESRRLAGILLVVLPAVMIGGISLLTLGFHLRREPVAPGLVAWRARPCGGSTGFESAGSAVHG